ncbi:hypothetical protein H6G80_02980 [Nostoc sp. FACHB-87]|uniref:DUF7219 family protein n=1 Tax=Nostocaceae TaxID=1162 RepID=UPI0016855FA5|nr:MULTISPECIES: hypothetical protein [Nostocaceae]MBD2453037.1 hypothetical protein [Nostoc sp. FACHB-87]MBD2475185.1 hypothetical protein [Anabaena sp. FACHB-83]
MNTNSDFLAELCDFLYPRNPYHGQLKAENITFNAHLQDFSQRVNYICSLQTGGKISAEDAYKQIHQLWKQLKQIKKSLEIDGRTEGSGSTTLTNR